MGRTGPGSRPMLPSFVPSATRSFVHLALLNHLNKLGKVPGERNGKHDGACLREEGRGGTEW